VTRTSMVPDLSRLRRPRWRPVAAAVAAAALAAGAWVAPEALGAAGPGFVPPKPAPVKAVPVAAVASSPIPTVPAMPTLGHRPKPVWPEAATAVVDLPVAWSEQAGGVRPSPTPAVAPSVRVGQMPVRVASATAASGRVRVDLFDRATTARAQVAGVLLRVGRADGQVGGASVRVSVDYGSFATAYGGDWASRLRLAALPECALSTPDRKECVGTALPSRNDPIAGSVTATAPVGLVALTAGPSGHAGSFAATSLQPSSTWSAGGNSGAFNWSYPMRVAPSPGGPAPQLALSYSSQSVDGRHAASNNQPSWIGEGFEFWPGGFIERRYTACAKDMGGSANNGTKTGDECWETDNATLSLNGHSGELIYNASDSRWHLRGDDGSRIQRLTGATNGDDNGEYWVVTTTDGTQFWFGTNRLPGWTAGAPETNSTWTLPVFGNEPGEPCHGTAFADSDCVQAWRWNLDYVVDLSNNSSSYWYVKETNRYGRNNTPSDAAPYDRGGYLSHIAYGTRRDTTPEPDVDSIFTTAAPAKVVFGAADRCLSSCTIHDALHWPDTPWDSDCAAAPCTTLTPTFWTTKRLATVTTQVWRGSAYGDVERWTFTHTFPDPGDGTRAGLWLSKISRAGLVGTTATVPDVEFTGVQLANRVDTTGDFAEAMNWWRIAMVRNETGGTISVNYSAPDCVAGQPMPDPSTNTRRCYPVRWTPEGYLNPVTDWFHKYVVTTIYEDAHTGGAPPRGSPRVVYAYSYLDGAAWHFTDDDGLIDPEGKTWSQWRGYGRVGLTVGDPGEQTYAESRFLRGMHGDHLPSGTRTVMVSGTGVPDVADEDAFAGMTRESTAFNGPGGAVVSRQVLQPWQSSPTATRTINGTTVYARFTGTAASHDRKALDGGRPDRVTTVQTTFDTYGMPVQVDDTGDASATGDELCTKTEYEPRNANAWLMTRPHRVRSYALPCASTGGALTEADVIGEVHTSYDNQTYLTQPTRGLPTRVETMATWNGGAPTFTTIGRVGYDARGRVVQAWNAADSLTSTAYTPSTGGPVTATTVTNALNHVSSATVDPAWGTPTMIVDANGKRTELAHDGLGRVTGVWLPNRDRATESASTTFAYLVRTDGATAVSTSQLHSDGTYITSHALFDGMLRPRQTQVPSPSGGRLLTDTFYDSAGRAVKEYGSYYATGTPDTTLVTATQATDVPSQVRTVLDGAGRPTASVFQPNDVARWSTLTSYAGDRIDVTPPSGGTATSTVTDARGRTVELRQYQAATPTGSYDATRYTFNRKGQLERVTDPAGNRWTYTYDLRGRLFQSTDPDKGATTLGYDNAGRVTSSTDARQQKLFYAWDPLDRKRTVRENTATGPLRAQWSYDTIAKGLPTQSTRYVGATPYQIKVIGYNDLDQPTGTQVVIPAAETGLAGTYNFDNTWSDVDGSLLSTAFPSTGGDLPAETVSFGYSNLGLPTTQSTLLAPSTSLRLVAATAYNALGRIDQITLDTDDVAGGRVYQTVTRELETGRLTGVRADRDSVSPSTVVDLRYGFDPAGNVTKISDVAPDPVDDTQCFAYDHLRRLTEAWTPTAGNCLVARSVAALGGPAPYWHSWTFDVIGNRRTQTMHAAGGDSLTNYSYPAAGASRPHALSNTTGTQPGEYAYDLAGNTTCRPVGTTANNCGTGSGSQTLTWDAEGKLATSVDATGSTSYLYDANGNRLIRRDPTGKTLYLPSEEIRYTTATATTAATRYYTHAGQTFASRTAAGLVWLTGDHQGTASVSINQATQAATIRRQLPYGAPRGTSPPWPNGKGFVGGAIDNTGLTHLGAREYDPTVGRFISVDPVQDLSDPQQWNGYAYSNNNPPTFSDPSGLEHDAEAGQCSVMSVGCGINSRTEDQISRHTDQVDPMEPVVTYPADHLFVVHDPVTGDNYINGVLMPDGMDVEYALRQMSSLLSDPSQRLWWPQSWDLDTGLYGEQALVELLLHICGRDSCGKGLGEVFYQMYLPFVPIGFEEGAEAAAAGRFNRAPKGRPPVCRNSLDPETPVLMADGTRRAIKDVQIGDKVEATDPATGRTTDRVVTALHLNEDTELTDLTLVDGFGQRWILHTTAHHPFYDATTHSWTDAGQLTPGDELYTTDGLSVTVDAVRTFVGTKTMYNLTVEIDHTYYVLAGAAPVLVHNCGDLAEDDRLFPNAHVIDEHVTVTDATAVALARSKGQPNGIWVDLQTAQLVVDSTLTMKASQIKNWLRGSDEQLVLKGYYGARGGSLGRQALPDGTIRRAGNEYTVILQREKGHPGGFYVWTAYPG